MEERHGVCCLSIRASWNAIIVGQCNRDNHFGYKSKLTNLLKACCCVHFSYMHQLGMEMIVDCI